MNPNRVLAIAGLFASPLLLRGDLSPAQPENSPFAIHQTWDPSYPAVASGLGLLDGKTTIVVSVDEHGRLTDALAVSYTHPCFAESALAAVSRWTFEPARFAGRPISVTKPIAFSFEQRGIVLVNQSPTEHVASQIQEMTKSTEGYRAYSIREIDRSLKPTHLVEPDYPEALRSAGVAGTVKVSYYVDESGRVRMPIVINDANPVLADSVVAAVQQWRFDPPTRSGRPVLVRVAQGIDFNPKG